MNSLLLLLNGRECSCRCLRQEAGCDMEGRSTDGRSCKTVGPPTSAIFWHLPAARGSPFKSTRLCQYLAAPSRLRLPIPFPRLCQSLPTLVSSPQHAPSPYLRHLLAAPGSSRQFLSFPTFLPLTCSSWQLTASPPLPSSLPISALPSSLLRC
jgi:hypothetical protein